MRALDVGVQLLIARSLAVRKFDRGRERAVEPGPKNVFLLGFCRVVNWKKTSETLRARIGSLKSLRRTVES